MFTGIIETTGKVESILHEGSNLNIRISSSLYSELKVDQSIAHNGVCLTVTNLNDGLHEVTAVQETLNRSNLRNLKPGDLINLERCMPVNGRFDGHIVQGHVDDTALCTDVQNLNGSWMFNFKLNDPNQKELIVDKGSICINGVSLTVVKITGLEFLVTIIPYTFEHTNFGLLKVGDQINIEFDILGKYIQKMIMANR